MAVYVDDMRAPFGKLIMCHMLADSDEELHAMAASIGVKREWWQSPEVTSGSHYDICLSKKALALRLGAIPITLRQAALMNAHRRKHGHLCTPEEASSARPNFTGRSQPCPASQSPTQTALF